MKSGVATWQAYNTVGRLRPVQRAGRDGYGDRSLAVSLDRPYDHDGAFLFLVYERKLIKLAERMGLPLAYLTSMDIAADPRPAGRGQRAGLARARRVLDAAGARARDRGPGPRREPGVPGRQRDVPADPARADRARRRTGWSSATRPATQQDPMYGKDNALVTNDFREPRTPTRSRR